MLDSEEEVSKIRELVKNKFPNLTNEEIEKVAHQLMELGSFLVRLQIKKHPNSSVGGEDELLTDKPP